VPTYQDILNPHTVTELCKRQLIEVSRPNGSEQQEQWFRQLKELRAWQAGCAFSAEIPANVLKTLKELLETEIDISVSVGYTAASDDQFQSASASFAEAAEYQEILDKLLGR